MNIQLSSIRIDGGTQSRVQLSTDAVVEYTEAITEGHEMPPVVVFFDGVNHWLADGFHRFHATRNAGQAEISADVRTGTQRDAILFSASANGNHGLRRTNADKRKSVEMLLTDMDWCRWPETKIADHCHVSRSLVRAVIEQLHLVEKQDSKREVTRNGKTYTQDISGMSRPKAERKEQKPAVEEPEPEDFDDSEHVASALAEENERLREQLAIKSMDATEEERQSASDLIAQIKRDLSIVTAERDAIASSRDSLMHEVAELKKQVNYWKRKVEKHERSATS